MNELIGLYIDPGTGSMLFTVLIGIIGFLIYIAKVSIVKLKFFFTRGKIDKTESEKIPYLIFAEDKRYWQQFKPVCDEFEKRGIDVEYWTTNADDPVLDLKYEHVKFVFAGEGNKAFAKLNMVNASIVLSTTPGLEVYQWKKSKFVDYYVHMYHSLGCGGYRLFGMDYYDAILTSGQYQIDIIRELEAKRHLPAKELKLVGMPYFDAMKERLDNTERVHNEKPVVLLAPSWGESSILNRLGESVIDELLKTDYDIIIRPHPQSFIADAKLMDDLKAKYPDSDRLTWDRSPNNFDVLNKADILISDYSGVFYDFALIFDKPIMYMDTNHDNGWYDYYSLDDQTPWVMSNLPKMGMEINKDNLKDIGKLIDECLHSEELSEVRDQIRADAWVNIGEGASRTVDYLTDKYKELAEKKKQQLQPSSSKKEKKNKTATTATANA